MELEHGRESKIPKHLLDCGAGGLCIYAYICVCTHI